MHHDVSVRSAGELTFDTVQSDLRRLLAFIRGVDAPAVYIELSSVTVCDSAGLAMLLELKRLSAHENKRILFNGLPRCIEGLAEFCGVDLLLFKP